MITNPDFYLLCPLKSLQDIVKHIMVIMVLCLTKKITTFSESWTKDPHDGSSQLVHLFSFFIFFALLSDLL